MTRLFLGNADYARHMTDEGDQLQRGMEAAGWTLVLPGSTDGHETERHVPALLDKYSPTHVFVHDKRDWSEDSPICYRKGIGYTGIEALAECKDVERFCVVKDAGSMREFHRAFVEEIDATAVVVYYHPDSVVPPHTPARYLEALAGRDFGMASSRCIYYEMPDKVQTDGGFVNRRTGLCSAANIGKPVAATPLPDASALDFLTGANTIDSRRFLDQVGLMPEDYFLYFEEVDWAFRRNGFALELVDGAEIYHHGGSSIGSGAVHRRPTAFANYFNHRNRLRFVRRHLPASRGTAMAWTLAKAAQIALVSGRPEAWAILAGALDRRPPAQVSSRIKDPAARRLAFGARA